MTKHKLALLSSLPLLTLFLASEVSALSFTTAPSTINFVNEFEFNVPSSRATFTVNTTIASAEGAPELIGQSLTWVATLNDDFTLGSFSIGGLGANFAQLLGPNLFLNPPEEFDCTSFAPTCVLRYTGVYNLFNPNAGTPLDTSGSVELPFTFNFDLPIAVGYEYFLGGPCGGSQFSSVAGLTEISGCAVLEYFDYRYVEGSVRNATITFGTPSPVPLPATAWLMMAGVSALGFARRKRASTKHDTKHDTKHYN